MPHSIIFGFHGFYDEAIDMQKTDKLMYMSRTGGNFIVVHPQVRAGAPEGGAVCFALTWQPPQRAPFTADRRPWP